MKLTVLDMQQAGTGGSGWGQRLELHPNPPGKPEQPPRPGLSQPWVLYPAPTLGASSDAAVPTRWMCFWGCTDSPAARVIPGHPDFYDQLFQGPLCALLCRDLQASSPQALVHVVPDSEEHHGPRHPHGSGVTSPLLKLCWELACGGTGAWQAFRPEPQAVPCCTCTPHLSRCVLCAARVAAACAGERRPESILE